MPETKLEKLRKRVTQLEQELKQEIVHVRQLEKAIVGVIIPYGGALDEQKRPGSGWLFCDGRALSQAEYPELYTVIGKNFGDGTTDQKGNEITGKDFNLPDLRGRFVRGVDHGTKRDPDAGARKAQKPGGEADEVGSLQDDAFKEHEHPLPDNVVFHVDNAQTEKRYQGGPHGTIYPSKCTLNQGDKETRPKNIYVNWIIYAGR